MHLDLADLLRCPADHEESWLVVHVRTADGRQLTEGTLGCPVCGREYPVQDGVADFRDSEDEALESSASAAVTEQGSARVLRAAALLGLGDGVRVVLLAGSVAPLAPALGAFATLRAIALDPIGDVEPVEHVSVLLTSGRAPLADASLHGAMLGGDARSRARVGDMTRLLKSKGRLIAPADVAVPSEITELARDDEEWVGERVPAASKPVPLTLAR